MWDADRPRFVTDQNAGVADHGLVLLRQACIFFVDLGKTEILLVVEIDACKALMRTVREGGL